jgi:hypothetical protein
MTSSMNKVNVNQIIRLELEEIDSNVEFDNIAEFAIMKEMFISENERLNLIERSAKLRGCYDVKFKQEVGKLVKSSYYYLKSIPDQMIAKRHFEILLNNLCMENLLVFAYLVAPKLMRSEFLAKSRAKIQRIKDRVGLLKTISNQLTNCAHGFYHNHITRLVDSSIVTDDESFEESLAHLIKMH